jgi:hypothetical protein
MLIPTLPFGKVIDEETNDFTSVWKLYEQDLNQALQAGVSNEGFVIPSVTAENAAILEPLVEIGTLIFNEDEVNGGTMDEPNGQLFIKLADGTFHAIPNL